MTEAEWLACDDPQAMVAYLCGKPFDRKLRLFGCACCRSVWDLLTEDCFRNAVEVAERFADGNASKKELAEAKKISGAALQPATRRGITGPQHHAVGSAWSTTRTPVGSAAMYPLWVFSSLADRKRQVTLLRDLFGNPFNPLAIESAWLAWNDGAVQKMAQSIYDARAFDRLPLLADAFKDAGCTDIDILNHCRTPGEHVRGCWVVDLLLGKS